MAVTIYNLLAELLSYPTEAQICRSAKDAMHVDGQRSRVNDLLASFDGQIRPLSLHERQELFIQTFDLNPLCSLEMGWHLFGENYDRGLLLVKMRQQMRAHGLAETTELPDHLTNGIQLLGVMERNSASYFAEAIVLPSLEKMLATIHGKQNPYEHLLEAARLAIRNDFPDAPSQLAVRAGTPDLKVLA